MKFRQRPSQDVRIDMTSLIDVVFLLLIFFMLSTTFKKYNQLSVELPSSASSQNALVTALEIGVDSQGAYHFEKVSFGQDSIALKNAIQAYIQQSPSADIQVAIVGDKKAPHQSIVSVMDVANQLGIHKLKIVAEST